MEYLAELNAAINEDRLAQGKRPLKPRDTAPGLKETKVSTTDPESGFMTGDNKP
ncbi:hypothetical protein GCM10017655_09560 [Pseudomonas turukhanskensis]|uniref:Transposase n=1 Tax=Pseudomonas turukhanskensis TaxID=1806536 RepID=A0A9W6NDR5_9PSED|nr:hypothetical protein GCM10017655_09560 [Pseudomonas turukhanskensis]